MAEENVRLSPPPYTYFNFIKHSIGNDSCLEVLEMQVQEEGNYLIQIEVQDRRHARALAAILELHKNIGNENIYIEVLHKGTIVEPQEDYKTMKDFIKMFETALCSNRYFNRATFIKSLAGYPIVFLIFKKEVIQFFNDDISDFFNNFNGVAADVFREVLKPAVHEIWINPSTAMERKNQTQQKNRL